MEPTTDTGTAPVLPELPLEQLAHLEPHLKEGWKYREKRRQICHVRLTRPQVGELGHQAAKLDVELKTKRQGRNARQAALNREKKEREGAIHNLSTRLLEGFDELSRPMDVESKAAYSERIAALRAEYDAFEVARKEELQALKEELEELEGQAKKVAAKIASGHGDMPVTVIDLVDFASGIVRSIRLDTGGIWAQRELAEHERQLGLFTSRVEYPELDAHEYALAVRGRLWDAARYYVKRTALDLTEAGAVGIIRQMLPDEQLPPEEGELPPEKDDAHDEGEPPLTDEALVAMLEEHGKREGSPFTPDFMEQLRSRLPLTNEQREQIAAGIATLGEPGGAEGVHASIGAVVTDVRYDVVVEDVGPAPKDVTKLLRDFFGHSLKAARELVDGDYPRTVATAAPEVDAVQLVARLRTLGAKADVRRVGS
jgi:ribosomal protein L7/L12